MPSAQMRAVSPCFQLKRIARPIHYAKCQIARSGVWLEMNGKPGITPDPPNSHRLAADCGPDGEIFPSFKNLSCCKAVNGVGLIQTAAAVTDVPTPIVIRRDADSDVSLPGGPHVAGTPGIVVKLHVSPEPSLGSIAAEHVVIQANQQFGQLVRSYTTNGNSLWRNIVWPLARFS